MADARIDTVRVRTWCKEDGDLVIRPLQPGCGGGRVT
jgi:hypothetical protein